jgi:hypothetical protein
MTDRRCGLTLTSLFAALLLLAPAHGADEPSAKSSLWMKQKLQFSRDILQGLTEADHEAIGRNAQAMNIMEFFEKWSRADDPDYRTQLRLFEFSNRALIRAAREKNLDAATLAYTQLTVSCVNCHKVVRDVER